MHLVTSQSLTQRTLNLAGALYGMMVEKIAIEILHKLRVPIIVTTVSDYETIQEVTPLCILMQ